ncbi:MAG: glutamate racemase [Muribaculaceae bacterium]|nr:glutamate racemase [Muribaculaceae bacterium]MDE7142819.1 glutamate racemase [Muribaculaceae bacterium]
MQHLDYSGPIGVFDSGYGGLTILREFQRTLPDYDYVYLGDNARAPYGSRSFDVIYRFTLEAVNELFARGCPLVILACNTASAKALRTIQQTDLPEIDPTRRVLGVIRPTIESLPKHTRNGHIGLVGTTGTVNSRSYDLEIEKLYPDYRFSSHSCPMWVHLVENDEADKPGADYFVRQEINALLRQDPEIDSLILGCTHYPLLIKKIRQYLPPSVALIKQGEIVAESLADYLTRHPEMEQRITRGGATTYLTTEDPAKFAPMASMFLAHTIEASQVLLG